MIPLIGRSRSAWRLALGIAAAAALALPAPAAATNECVNLANCTSLPASSWMIVPAGSGASPGTAGTVLFCPADGDQPQLAIGSDYLLSGAGSNFKLYVNRSLLQPGSGLTRGSDAHFFVANDNSVGVSIKPIVGCVAGPPLGVRAGQQPRRVVRVREVRLRPSRRAAYLHRCRAGERLVHGVPGVLVHTRRPPSAREVRHVTVVRRVTRRGVRVVVRTGPSVGDRERVTLQIVALCRR
jgi:hypothetical protein